MNFIPTETSEGKTCLGTSEKGFIFLNEGTREVFMNACGSLNGLGPHNLIESDTNWSGCGLVGRHASLWRWV